MVMAWNCIGTGRKKNGRVRRTADSRCIRDHWTWIHYWWRGRSQSPGSLLWFRLLHRGLLCAALSFAHERLRRLVIGHVLLRGHARDRAADNVESQVL